MPHTYSLRKLKVLDKASQETVCFEATLVIDKKSVGSVTNSGWGGPNEYAIDEALLAHHSKHINPWVDAYMEALYAESGGDYDPSAWRQDNLDIMIGRLIALDDVIRFGRRKANLYAKRYNLPREEVLVYHNRRSGEVVEFHQDLLMEVHKKWPDFEPLPEKAALTI